MKTIFYDIRLITFIVLVLILASISLLVILWIVGVVFVFIYLFWNPLLVIVLAGLTLIFVIGFVISFFIAAFRNDPEILRAYLRGCKELLVRGVTEIYERVIGLPRELIVPFRDGWTWVQVGSKSGSSNE